MKKTMVHAKLAKHLLAALCAAAISMGAAAAPKLLVAGDSSTSDYDASKMPHRSWARALEKHMKPGITIDNYARGGASTKSFLASGLWEKLVAAIKPGDYVLIQFGGNDQKRYNQFYIEKRFADPNGLYREIVRRFVKDVREKGGKPVLVSSCVRGTFDANGKLCQRVDKWGVSLLSYAKAMKELSEELHTEFVDMNTLTYDHLSKIGKDAAMKYYVISTGWKKSMDDEPSKDTTHTIDAGADMWAKVFVEDVKKRNLDIAELFK